MESTTLVATANARPGGSAAGLHLAVLIAAASWLAVPGCAPRAGPDAAPDGGGAAVTAAVPDTAAVRALLMEQVAAWNRGDLDAFLDGYWRSDSLTFYSGGTVSHGWQAAHDRYVRRYRSGDAEMGRLAFDLHALVPLDAAHVLVKGEWRLTMRSDHPRGLFTLIVRRLPRGWRVVHDHSSAGE
jgi:beta-aspartyl-peptidase (threonine type)